MLSTVYLIWLTAKLVVLGTAKWIALTILCIMSPAQALECLEEMEAENVHEQP